MPTPPTDIRRLLHPGMAIPTHPLALTTAKRLDERRQRALSRYYVTAGVGGLAVAVHTTQLQIREPSVGLFEPVLRLAAEEMDTADRSRDVPLARIGGVCGRTGQAAVEAMLLRDLGYHAGLLSLAAMRDADEDALIDHCRQVAGVIPVVGSYLQPAVGGRALPYAFWRRFAEIENVVAVKITPFDRHQTLDVVRAVTDAGRDDVALYTGNDNNIVLGLLTPYRVPDAGGRVKERRIIGGLLGHWSVWTQTAVVMRAELGRGAQSGAAIGPELLDLAVRVTDANAAFFDTANAFRGCIAGLHEVLRRHAIRNEVVGLFSTAVRTQLPGTSHHAAQIFFLNRG